MIMFAKLGLCAIFCLGLSDLALGSFSDCGSVAGSYTAIEIPGCDSNSDERCVLKRGTNASINIDFKPNEDVDAVTALVHGIILGVPVAFQLPNPDGCKDSGITCPLKTGEIYKYEAQLPVLRKYPRVTVDVKWELQDKDGKDIVCILIPAKLE